MVPHDIGGKKSHEVNYDYAGNHPESGEMRLMMTDGSEKVIQVRAEYTVGKAEEKLQNKEGNPERYNDEQPGSELLFQMGYKFSHDALPANRISVTMKDTCFTGKVNIFECTDSCLRSAHGKNRFRLCMKIDGKACRIFMQSVKSSRTFTTIAQVIPPFSTEFSTGFVDQTRVLHAFRSNRLKVIHFSNAIANNVNNMTAK
jgi:hypothetical protein